MSVRAGESKKRGAGHRTATGSENRCEFARAFVGGLGAATGRFFRKSSPRESAPAQKLRLFRLYREGKFTTETQVMRKNSKTIENANSASMKSDTCNAHFCEKGIFSHDHRVRRVRSIFLIKNSLLRALRASAVSYTEAWRPQN